MNDHNAYTPPVGQELSPHVTFDERQLAAATFLARGVVDAAIASATEVAN